MSVTIDRNEVSAEWLLRRAPGQNAADLGAGLASLIRSGELPSEARLPTVRDLAKSGGTSVATVLAAWAMLREQGLIETRRRGGTVVLPLPRATDAPAGFAGWSAVDLGQCGPDLALQPSLHDALLASLEGETLNVFGREYMTDLLRDAVAPEWPFPPEAWATAGGGTEALLLAIEAAAPPGSIIAVDEPLGPGVLDTVRDLGITAIGVSSDEQGPRPESLAVALQAGAVAFVFQPGAAFSLQHAVTERRVAELARVVRDNDHPVWVVEDDALGPLERQPAPTLGVALPQQVLRIRSYCKAYGIDVRTSVLAGPTELVERAMRLRSHGVGSNSRILQNALAYLLKDAEAARVVAGARTRYAHRRDALAAALGERGLTVRSGPDSLVVWVEVSDETSALIDLARHGISAGAGSRSFVVPPERPLLRLGVTQLPDDAGLVRELAGYVAHAASASSREYFD